MLETDSQLVCRALGGDSTAFDELVERYRARAFRTALSKLGIREEASDIAQEAFVRAYMSLGTLKDPERFAPWLMTIVANLCKMRLRKPQELILAVDIIDSMHAAVNAEPEWLPEALSVLPDGTRRAATLFFVEGMKQTEIATSLGISLPAVKARIREAKTRIHKEMSVMVTKPRKHDEPGDEFNSSLKHKLELARWYGELADGIETGLNLMYSLDALSNGNYSASVREATQKMMDAIQAGSTMTEALSAIPALSSPEASALIHAGEMVGSLHIAARFLSDWFNVQNAQRDIELIFWCRTFGYMLTAGVTILESLNYGLDIACGKALQQATRDMTAALEKTRTRQPTQSPLRPVLDKYADVFPPILRVVILAGEWTGTLDKALFWAADEMADDLALSIARTIIPAQRELNARQFRVSGIEEAFPAFCVRLLSDPAPDIRAAAIDVLGRLGSTDTAPAVLALFDDDSAEVRKTAIRVIARLGYKDGAESLIQSLHDPDMNVRIAAIESITKLELDCAAQSIADTIQDTDRMVVVAIESLVALKRTDILRQKAIDLFHSDSFTKQKVAAYILRNSLLREVVQGLVSELESKHDLSPNELDAVCALGWYGCSEAVPILNRMLGDPKRADMVARGLRGIGDAASVTAIREAIRVGALEPSASVIADELEARLAGKPY